MSQPRADILLVLDVSATPDCVRGLSDISGKRVALLALTSRDDLRMAWRRELLACGAQVEDLAAPDLIDLAAERLRPAWLAFVARLGRSGRDGLGLADRFGIDTKVSLWWLSLVAEKNTMKSEAFNLHCQFEATAGVADARGVELLACSLRSDALTRALEAYAVEMGWSWRDLGRGSVRHRLVMGRLGRFLGAGIGALAYGAKSWLIGAVTRAALPVPGEAPFVTVAYFPFFDEDAAARGIFRHTHCAALQEAWECGGRRWAWLLVWVRDGRGPLWKALAQAARLARRGARLMLTEQFLTLASLARAIWRLACGAALFWRLEPELARDHRVLGRPCYELWRDDWISSFVGRSGMAGLLYHESFRRAWRKLKPRTVLYFCEMHAWERAMLCAARAEGVRRTLGYQSGTVSPMLLNYHHVPEEISAGGTYPLPRPSLLLVNGSLNRDVFVHSGWPQEEVVVVEAVRYGHLGDVRPCARVGPTLLLLSLCVGESAALLAVVHEVWREFGDAQWLVRPHPALRMDRVLRQAGLGKDAMEHRLALGPLEEVLRRCPVIIAGETGVALEALAFGCRVIRVRTAEHVDMSPLRGVVHPAVRVASSVPDLRRQLREALADQGSSDLGGSVWRGFFCVGESGSPPERFLDILSREDAVTVAASRRG